MACKDCAYCADLEDRKTGQTKWFCCYEREYRSPDGVCGKFRDRVEAEKAAQAARMLAAAVGYKYENLNQEQIEIARSGTQR